MEKRLSTARIYGDGLEVEEFEGFGPGSSFRSRHKSWKRVWSIKDRRARLEPYDEDSNSYTIRAATKSL